MSIPNELANIWNSCVAARNVGRYLFHHPVAAPRSSAPNAARYLDIWESSACALPNISLPFAIAVCWSCSFKFDRRSKSSFPCVVKPVAPSISTLVDSPVLGSVLIT